MLHFYGAGKSLEGGCCHFVIICQLHNNERAKLIFSMCAVPGYNIHYLCNHTTVVSAREAGNNQIPPHPGPGKARTVKPLRSGAFLPKSCMPSHELSDQRCQFILGTVP